MNILAHFVPSLDLQKPFFLSISKLDLNTTVQYTVSGFNTALQYLSTWLIQQTDGPRAAKNSSKVANPSILLGICILK